MTAKHQNVNEGFLSAIAFLGGAFVSSLCAYLGMTTATRGNVRTTIAARTGLSAAFRVAYESGAVMVLLFADLRSSD